MSVELISFESGAIRHSPSAKINRVEFPWRGDARSLARGGAAPIQSKADLLRSKSPPRRVVCCQSRGRILPSTKTHHLLSRWINANCYGLFQDSVVGESCIMICFNIHMKKSLKDDLKGISSRLDLSHLLFIIVANHELT